MAFVRLTSLADTRLNPFRDLKPRPPADGSRWLIAEGRLVVERLLASDLPVEAIVTTEQGIRPLASSLPTQVPVFVLGATEISQLVGFQFHRGLLAAARRPPWASLERLAPSYGDKVDASRTLLVCPQIADPVNLAGIVRAACCQGASGVLLGPRSADPFSRRAVRVSMGGVLHLPIRVTCDLENELKELRRRQFSLVAAVVDPEAELLTAVPRTGPTAILLGAEGPGLDARHVALCDRRATLRMHAQMDSLNVAQAAAVFLYHFCEVAVCVR